MDFYKIKSYQVLFIIQIFLGHEPYDNIKLLPFNIEPNLFNREKQLSPILSKLRKDRNLEPIVVIEIGCFRGRSTIFFGNQVKPHGMVFAVDHWLGSPKWSKNEWQKGWRAHCYWINKPSTEGLRVPMCPDSE